MKLKGPPVSLGLPVEMAVTTEATKCRFQIRDGSRLSPSATMPNDLISSASFVPPFAFDAVADSKAERYKPVNNKQQYEEG